MTTLQITDGVTTANLQWHSSTNRNYLLAREGWAPNVAGLRAGAIGGRGPYADVTEEISVIVCGDTPAAVLANQAALVQLLDQARRWADGEPVACVRLEYQPDGAALLATGVVLGPAGDGGVGGPPSYNESIRMQTLPVRVRLLRRGQWLAPAESAVTSASVNVGDLWTCTLGVTHPLPSPIALALSWTTSAITVPAGLVAIAASSADLALVNGATFTAAAQYSLVSATADLARGGNVLRLTHLSGQINTQVITVLPYASVPALLKSGPKVVDCYAVMRRSGTTPYRLRLYGAQDGVITPSGVATAYQPIGSGDLTIPGIISLGALTIPEGGLEGDLGLDIVPLAIGGTIDLDTLLFVERKSSSRVVATLAGRQSSVIFGANAVEFAFDATQLTDPQPFVGLRRVGVPATRQALSYQGDAYLFATGQTVAGVWLLPTANFFRYPNGAGTAPLTHTATVTRRRGMLVPQ